MPPTPHPNIHVNSRQITKGNDRRTPPRAGATKHARPCKIKPDNATLTANDHTELKSQQRNMLNGRGDKDSAIRLDHTVSEALSC